MARLRLTLVLNSGARIGPGKAALLESIHSEGSISAAARAMGTDYKRAWLLLDSINQAFKIPAVERATGVTAGAVRPSRPSERNCLPDIAALNGRR